MSATYPVRPKSKPYDRSLARRLAIIEAINSRLADLYTPSFAAGEFPGTVELREYREAVRRDQLRDEHGGYLGLDDGDFLQILYALGTHCVFHGTAFVDSDPDRKTCLPCEFDTADRRYRGHAVIPYPAGEVIR